VKKQFFEFTISTIKDLKSLKGFIEIYSDGFVTQAVPI